VASKSKGVVGKTGKNTPIMPKANTKAPAIINKLLTIFLFALYQKNIAIKVKYNKSRPK
jgi:hypothetical protein